MKWGEWLETADRQVRDTFRDDVRVSTVFLGLDQKWQYIFQGLLIVVGAILYSQVRRSAIREPGQI